MASGPPLGVGSLVSPGNRCDRGGAPAPLFAPRPGEFHSSGNCSSVESAMATCRRLQEAHPGDCALKDCAPKDRALKNRALKNRAPNGVVWRAIGPSGRRTAPRTPMMTSCYR
nr:hypothetical protein GCM10020241_57660 [Streptoalloteichus tenebrarius]